MCAACRFISPVPAACSRSQTCESGYQDFTGSACFDSRLQDGSDAQSIAGQRRSLTPIFLSLGLYVSLSVYKKIPKSEQNMFFSLFSSFSPHLSVYMYICTHVVLVALQDGDSFVDAFLETPLHVAAWSGHEEAVRLLVVKHPEWVEKQNIRGRPGNARESGMAVTIKNRWEDGLDHGW